MEKQSLFIKNSNKIQPDIINKISSNGRIIMNGTKDFVIRNNKPKQGLTLKPIGLWYAIGDSWISWVRSEMPEWEKPYVYEIEVDDSEILKIDISNINSFFKKYRSHDKISWMIDWKKVSKDYKGFEVNDFNSLYQYRLDMNFMWLYAMDVSSGCIWDTSVIKNLKQIT